MKEKKYNSGDIIGQSNVRTLDDLLHKGDVESERHQSEIPHDPRDMLLLIPFIEDEAEVFKTNRDYKEAFRYYFAVLKLYQRTQNNFGIAYTYNNLGICCILDNKYKKAVEFHLNAFRILKKQEDLAELSATYSFLSIAYEGLGKIEKALCMSKQSRKLLMKLILKNE